MELTTLSTSPTLRTTKTTQYIQQAKSSNTVKSYKSDWQDFVNYCTLNNADPLSANIDIVSNYIAELAETKKVSTIQRRLSSISQAYQAMGLSSPTFSFNVKAVMKGIKNERGN